MSKHILTRIGETIENYNAEKKSDLQNQLQSSRSKISNWLQWILPNGGTIIIVLALLVTQPVWARSFQSALNASSSTGTIAYQGRLADPSGTPLTSTYPMVFRLYNV